MASYGAGDEPLPDRARECDVPRTGYLRAACRITGAIVTIDHFGNLITNIDSTMLASFREPVVHAGNVALVLRRTYGDCQPGVALALVNSFGVIEIAVAEGRAAESLGLSRGAPVVVRDGVRRR
jgi:S-adenosylmethionine hydrolase